MTSAVDQVLARLEAVGFKTRRGDMLPFGERIPLVSGTAWDATTAQLVLVAEDQAEATIEEWRQLLFAGSALRHHLASDGPGAFGTPVIVAIASADGRNRLRQLAEDLAKRYVVFDRVDLNIVLISDLTNPELLDDALAPLLPRCRMALGKEISKQEVKRFWSVLEDEVIRAACQLDDVFGDVRPRIGEEAARALVADSLDLPDLPSPSPIGQLRIRNFRSIRKANVRLSPITIIHGPNGGGKSSLLEALELVWAGTSQRKPPSVSADEYARHLPYNGEGSFEVIGDDSDAVTDVADQPCAELARCVLAHETVTALVSQSPEERYSALLATTGLEIPDLDARTGVLLDEAKVSADRALRSIGVSPLPRRDSHGENHLRTALCHTVADRLPPPQELIATEEILAAASEGAYESHQWQADEDARNALLIVDALISRLLDDSVDLQGLAPKLDDAEQKVRSLTEPLQSAAHAVRVLVSALQQATGERAAPAKMDAPQARAAAIPPELAVRWLSHVKSLRAEAARFREDAGRLRDLSWRERLLAYSAALDSAADAAPAEELTPVTLATPLPPRRQPRPQIPADLFHAAGFSKIPAATEPLTAPLCQLLSVLERHVQALETLSRDLQRHPSRGFAKDPKPVLDALCRFELARRLRREGPILKASEQLVSDLLQEKLAPLVRELVAAIVRFEWYFKPLRVPNKGRRIVLGGLATTNDTLDARLVLNSAERSALGLAWFMALHLLQPKDRRRVLVMDDPASVFDSTNQAGFASTLRAFVRLTRPEQVVLAAHNDAAASVLADELAPVDGWPKSVSRLRCQRDASDFTAVTTEVTGDKSRSMEEEAAKLRLLGEAPALE